MEQDGYRLDLNRFPNANRCFVYGEPILADPGKTLTSEMYTELCQELEQQTFDRCFDDLINQIREEYTNEINILYDMMDAEDPTCQMPVWDFIFLGKFEWLQQELWLLNRCRDVYDVAINESMRKTLQEIYDINKLFFTFPDLVIVTELE